MNDILLDTNIASYAYAMDRRLAPYREIMLRSTWRISIVTSAELLFGIERAQWGEKRKELFKQFLKGINVLDFDSKILDEYVRIRLQRERMGRPTEFEDLWIAATAIAYDLHLLSHNRKDFEGIDGLKLICHA